MCVCGQFDQFTIALVPWVAKFHFIPAVPRRKAGVDGKEKKTLSVRGGQKGGRA